MSVRREEGSTSEQRIRSRRGRRRKNDAAIHWSEMNRETDGQMN